MRQNNTEKSRQIAFLDTLPGESKTSRIFATDDVILIQNGLAGDDALQFAEVCAAHHRNERSLINVSQCHL